MRIYQNIAAMNAYRNLATTENRLNKSLERLSSGLRINRAADDAAGLAISEKMRAQIRGLNQAVRNAQDGISLIQTAEGALNETHSILQRMRELAVQAATGTNTSQDRMEIQREVDQLKTEIDRIANTTEFNTKRLLDGTTAALTSTDKLSTKVFMRDGLRVVDQFGQKAAGGGNYKIEINPDPGLGQVLKSDIMKIKHGTDYTFDSASGLTAVSAENLRFGSYTMATSAGSTVSAGADHTGGVLFAGYATSSLDLAISGSTTLSGSFGVKITDVDYQAGAFDYELLYRFYDETGAASEGFLTGTLSAGDTLDIAGLGVEVAFTETDITEYKTNEVATYYVNMGNDQGDDIVVDNVSISTGAYNTSINGVVHTAHATNSATISMEAGLWNDRISDFDVVQIDAAGNLSHGNARLTFESLVDSNAAVTFEYQGEIGQRATLDSTLHDLDRFWDSSGNFILENPQTLTLVQGDGAKANVTIFRSDTVYGIQEKLNAAIGNTKSFAGTIETGKGLGQTDLEGVGTDYTKFVQYVTHTGAAASGGTGFTSVQGTYVIQSAITGKAGEIYFVGNDNIIDALSLTTIQHSKENNFEVSVYDAHDRSKVVAQDVVINGNLLVGVVHANVDVEFHNNTGINTVWNDDTKQWEWQKTANLPVETFVHLADNTSVFHIGANPLQDVPAAIGDMRAAALGVDNILVTGRELANSAISKVDLAIQRVSSERSKMGALQNRLEHTISNLSVAAENLAAAESRIRDLDMAQEMMEFTKNQILMQAGTAMLAQANMKPQSVLQLLG